MSKLVAATRWFSALFVALAFLVGIPVMLLMAPSPFDSERGIGSIFKAIADDTQVFDEALISALVGFAWLLWAYLTLAAIAELVVAIRGGVASIRGLTMGQSLARPVVAALMWSSTATGLAASTLGAGAVALATAPAVEAQMLTHVQTADPAQNTNPHGFGEAISGDEIVDLGDQTFLIRGIKARPHVVQAEDTMWDLAEHHLGDGVRWKEIANLNPDIDDPDLIVAGSLIYLPAEAANINSPAPAAAPVEVTVADGDTIWGIAADQLDQDGADVGADQIAEVVAGVDPSALQSGDRDLIFPGEIIALKTLEANTDNTALEPEVFVWTAGEEEPTNDAGSVDLAQAIAAAEANLPQPLSQPAAVEGPAVVVEEPGAAEVLGRPPSGQFFGQFPSGAEPPAPPEGADIDVDAFPPIPETATIEAEAIDRSNGWDPPTAVAGDESAQSEPVATPSVPVPGGEPVQPESNTTVNPEDLAQDADSRTVKSLNWAVLLAALPLLGGGVWAALRRRRRLKASRRPSRYAPTDITETETDITDALAGSPALERAAKLEALSAQITRWIPLNAASLVAITVDDTEAAVLWDGPAPEPVGEPSSIVVDGSSWRIAADNLVTATDPSTLHGLPGLVHLGRLMSGRDLFVNLEELGRANFVGETTAIQQLCGRLSMELALSPMFSLGTLVLVGFGQQLSSIDNIEYYETGAQAHRALTPRIESLERALAINSALQLRASGQLDSDISPIVIIDLSDADPHPDLVEAAEASAGGLCLLHSGDSDSSWPLTVDYDSLHVGGALDVTLTSSEPSEETISQILAMVSADIEYEPADTVEGAISDSLVEAPVDDEDVDEWQGDVVAIDDHGDWPDSDLEVIDLTDDEADAAGPIADVGELVTATWPDPDPLGSSTGVRLRILGAVTVEGAEFSKKAARYVELLALMMAKGGKITLTEISTAMYNGEGNQQAILQLLRRTRKALGDAPDGQPRLSFETPTKQYELNDVSTDFDQIIAICNQIKSDETLSREQACKLMDSAAQLIEGPPYAAAGETYEWIYTTGGASQAVIAADSLCRELGEVYLALGNYPRARWSIRQGLKACPACDELYEALIRVTAMDGTRSDLNALWTEIEAAYEATDLEVPQTLATAYGIAVAA